jgi:membrane protease subunit (stomatin/prohibitin family)
MAVELIEIIENTTPDPNLLMWKFEDQDREIQNGAKLTVRESQRAMLVPYFEQLGIRLTRFIITSVTLPDEGEQAGKIWKKNTGAYWKISMPRGNYLQTMRRPHSRDGGFFYQRPSGLSGLCHPKHL